MRGIRKRRLRGEAAEEAMSVEIGRIGELEVELELVRRGWHALRLDTSQRAWNADLLCAKGPYRVAIQVKATDADKGHGHSKSLGFGYATGFLRDKKTVFNSKSGPLIADVVVAVSSSKMGSRFVVLPVGLAEQLCQRHIKWWYAIPTNTKTGKRSQSFPIYMNFKQEKSKHAHQTKMREIFLSYENKWDVLEEPLDRLRDGALCRISN